MIHSKLLYIQIGKHITFSKAAISLALVSVIGPRLKMVWCSKYNFHKTKLSSFIYIYIFSIAEWYKYWKMYYFIQMLKEFVHAYFKTVLYSCTNCTFFFPIKHIGLTVQEWEVILTYSTCNELNAHLYCLSPGLYRQKGPIWHQPKVQPLSLLRSCGLHSHFRMGSLSQWECILLCNSARWAKWSSQVSHVQWFIFSITIQVLLLK